MLKPDLQHQFWVTKKAVQRKLGTKEDECIVSSDAELDSKIDLLKSIADSCTQLKRIIDNYQERICILAQEENATGTFLKQSGKYSATSGQAMMCAGKAISYSGQQHIKMRAPLVRLQHEVDTFIGRAIKDTYNTVQAMEHERTEYRAALGWMKAASQQLDPDKGRGLDKFRNAQMYVRTAKTKFDTMTLDCLQKIDLLAAARCNMFSHGLVAYQAALIDYATKTSYTYQAALKILEEKPQYNFTILKELTQVPVVHDTDNTVRTKEMSPIDLDQMLFFKEDFEDGAKNDEENACCSSNTYETKAKETSPPILDISTTSQSSTTAERPNNIMDLLDMPANEPSETDLLLDVFGDVLQPPTSNNSNTPLLSGTFDLFKKFQSSSSATEQEKKSAIKKSKSNDKKVSAWMDLFADLDPLANLDTMEKKLAGANQNCLDA